MGLRSWLGKQKPDEAPVTMSADRSQVRFSGLGFDNFPYLLNDAGPGLRVSREQALAVPAVKRGRDLIAGTIGGLPLCVTDANGNRMRSPLLEDIDPDVANGVTLAQTVEDLLFEGLSWWRVLARGFDKFPTSARHVEFTYVSTQIPAEFPIDRLPSGYYPGSHVFIMGEPVPAADVIRFDSLNSPLLVSGARAIRRSLKLELTADRYADDPRALEYFSAVDGADPNPDDVRDMLDSHEAARRTRSTGYIPSGFQLNPVNVLTPAELQLVELQRGATLSLALILGVDPEDLGVSTTSRTYKNQVDHRQDMINHTFAPYLTAIQQRLSKPDVTKRNQTVAFDLDDFLKANPVDRMTIQTGYLAAQVLTRDEVRGQEGLPPLTPEQEITMPQPATQPPVQAPVNATAGSTSVNFSDDANDAFVFDDVDLAGTFSVNQTRRQITGMVAPWNVVGRNDQARWRFEPGSLKYDASKIDRIKLLIDHVNSAPVGKAIKAWSTDEGLWATFAVSRTPEGDRALVMAHEGTRDGLSVGLGQDNFAYGADPQDASIRVVTSAPWKETSLVAIPAFADARASAVTFAADTEGIKMPDTDTALAATVAAPGAAETQSIAQILEVAVANGIAAGFAANERPAVLNPVVNQTAQVSEAPLYRFDGGKAQRCFTGDLAAAANGDQDARVIVERFMANDMAALFTNITPANVAALNPVPTRPELYVPNLAFDSPMRSLVTTGALDNLIAFIVPKFSSSSGLVGTHTTGTEPSDGTYVTTTQTVTPKGLSGRVDLDREIIDSGGSPQADQIIYGDMVKEYSNVLETRIVDALQALTLSDTDITGANAALQAALIAEFAGLQYLRGGDRYNSLALDSTMYRAIVGAVDGDGRALFPMLGATNADGTVSEDMSSVRVAAKVGKPAWALETGNSGPQKSFLFVKGSVYQWNSAPRRFTFDQVSVASVAIGIWGYSAEAITRTTDVLQLAYAES